MPDEIVSSRVIIQDEVGCPRIVLGLGPGNVPGIWLLDEDGRDRACLALRGDSGEADGPAGHTAELHLAAGDGIAEARVVAAPGGSGFIEMTQVGVDHEALFTSVVVETAIEANGPEASISFRAGETSWDFRVREGLMASGASTGH